MRIPARHPSLHAPAVPIASARSGWPAVLVALGVYAAWLLAWYWPTVTSMVLIWYRSETFVHGFLIIPISAWLIWRRRADLAAVEPAPGTTWWPVLAMLGAAVLWLGGDLADVLAARHLAWMTMLIAGIWWLIGDRVARMIAFPLGFLYMAVPMGEFLLPTLMDWTADFTVWALRASGVPVLRDGTNFQIPTGSWSVVEACSGLRYLIASLTVGLLYAWFTYRTLWRRAAFVLASILVPIVANWMRAYLIVMIGHLSGNRLAVGIDHIIYGWVFFGIVMLLLFWLGNFWREDDAGAPAAPASIPAPVRRAAHTPRSWGTVISVMLLATAAAPLILRVTPANPAYPDLDGAAPVMAAWHPVAGVLTEWSPDFLPPRARIASVYASGDERAGLYIGVYYDQDHESKLVSSANQLIRTTDHSGYLVSRRQRSLDLAGTPLDVDEFVLRVGRQRLLARTWYWVDGYVTPSPVRAKIAQALARLRGRGDAGAIVVVYAPIADEGPPKSAALDDLTRAAALQLPAFLDDRLKAPASP